MAEEEMLYRRLKEIVERSKYWDAEFLLSNFEKEMRRLEQGLEHLAWDRQDRLVTACPRLLPLTPSFEVSETDEKFVVKLHVPNVAKENINLNINSNSVEMMACPMELTCRPYYISVESKSPIDPESAVAEFSEGFLVVRVLKLKTKRIEIR